ncbi:MAG: hypothetical protein QOE18_1424 [Chloroflexota bacterium]|nr:hypothetical protein [Chloroflexota bacterium]
MGDPRLGLVRRLPEGDPQVGGEEHRVVAEAVGPPWLFDQRAETLAPRRHRLCVRPHEGCHTDVARPPVIRGSPGNLVKEPPHAVGIGRVLTHPACRVWPRPTAQGVDLDAAVVGERRETGGVADRRRLGHGRLDVPGARLLELAVEPDIVERPNLPRPRGEQAAKLGDLPGVPGREDQNRTGHIAPLSTCAWSANSCCIPALARPSSESSSSRENGSCSAEPWSSMSRPSDDPTQFMSVSAAASSR